jgi:2-polyprenyl-6-methoxyphenol hydroxylase-like FAD-dependent oxidoreductase
MTHQTFAIVGGGIGGLTLAIALQRKGYQVTVYENAPELKPLGAGLVLAANAVRALMEIGIADEILKEGKILRTFQVKDIDGNVLTESNAEELSKKFGVVNNFTIHRADLHNVLESLLQPGTIQLGKGCVSFVDQSNHISLTFQDGSTATANYVIACDGVHSAIRKKLLPDSQPRYAGYTCYRAVIDQTPANLDIEASSETWGPGSRFGIVPLSKDRLYWFACINAKQMDAEMQALKSTELLHYFKNFHSPIKEVLKATPDDKIIWNDIIDIRPLKKFAFGNIILMGDAAHATTPNMGQGACMAIEDAAILANCIENYESPEEAFVQFEKRRIARTTKIVNTSWRIGKMAHLENPLLIALRNFALKRTPQKFTENQVKFLTDISFS